MVAFILGDLDDLSLQATGPPGSYTQHHARLEQLSLPLYQVLKLDVFFSRHVEDVISLSRKSPWNAEDSVPVMMSPTWAQYVDLICRI